MSLPSSMAVLYHVIVSCQRPIEKIKLVLYSLIYILKFTKKKTHKNNNKKTLIHDDELGVVLQPKKETST